MSVARQSYSLELKAQAVRMAVEDGLAARQPDAFFMGSLLCMAPDNSNLAASRRAHDRCWHPLGAI